MIVFDRVNHSYRAGQTSLFDFSVALEDGVWTCLFGDNGAGKSTVALLTNGLLKPDSGKVLVDGLSTADPASIDSIRRKIGLVFQNPDSQFVAATVEREVAFGLENEGVSPDEMRRRVDAMLDRFGIGRIRGASPHNLSEGEKTMVALASIVVMDPSFLVLDEPTSHLDREESDRFWSILQDMVPKPSVLLITQKRSEIERCERGVALASGRKTFDGTGTQLLAAAPASGGWQKLASELSERGLVMKEEPSDLDRLVQSIMLSKVEGSGRNLDRTATPSRHGRPGIESLSLIEAGYTYKKGLPGERAALKEATIQIEAGDFIGVTGPNGSGKTTLSLLLAGLLPPDSGRFLVNGEDLRRSSQKLRLRREVGFVFQSPERAFFTDSCLSEVSFGPKNFRLPDPEGKARKALELVGLDPEAFAGRSPFEISYGEQRRLAIACALAHDPPVIFCDEPTAGLDARGSSLVARILSVMKHSGRTVILVSHDLGLLLDLCDRAAVMSGGRVAYSGPSEGLMQADSGVRLTAEFEGTQEVLVRLRAAGLPVGDVIPSPRRAAHAILEALRREDKS